MSGGSGTLTEAAMAYQLNIPVIALVNTGGWADELAGIYIDNRKRPQVIPAETPQEAVDKGIGAIMSK